MRQAKRYRVRVTFKYPAWDEHDGFDYEIVARSKAEANTFARRRAYDDGHRDITVRATEIHPTEEA